MIAPLARCRCAALGASLGAALAAAAPAVAPAVAPWARHTIDDTSRGADGVRLADANGDGRLDIACGWEEGGVIRAYLHPGPQDARQPWPAVTVGAVKSPEDAVFVDLDGDGAMDIVSSTEGRSRTLFVHWAPRDPAEYLAADRWSTRPFPSAAGKQSWMYALPMQVDGRGGVDLIVGSKAAGAAVGWLQSPPDLGRARDLSQWTYHPLYRAGWIMSLAPHDVDGDGDDDVVISDRKGSSSGVLWLENPGPEAAGRGAAWVEHRIGAAGLEVMFLDIADLNGDQRPEVLVATRNRKIHWFERAGATWAERTIDNPLGAPHGKAIRAGDIDLDGAVDLVHSVNNGGRREQGGVTWLRNAGGQWHAHDISGGRGVKFDLVQLIDIDEDGDLDVLTCEERDNLGVFWYENPLRPRP